MTEAQKLCIDIFMSVDKEDGLVPHFVYEGRSPHSIDWCESRLIRSGFAERRQGTLALTTKGAFFAEMLTEILDG
jgi:hypothetical protein